MSERPPALKPTEPAALIVAALAAAAVAWLLISNFYQQLPPMVWPPVILIGGIAALEAAAARGLWERIHGRGGLFATRQRAGQAGARTPEPVDPLVVVRFAVLAKASSLGGAIFAGVYAGFLPWLAIESARLAGAGADLPPTVGGLLVSLALIAAALWLERACRVPEQADEDRADRDRSRDPGRRAGRPEDPRDFA
jgi:hypothetical protein